MEEQNKKNEELTVAEKMPKKKLIIADIAAVAAIAACRFDHCFCLKGMLSKPCKG